MEKIKAAWENFANAIIKQAADDYRRAYKTKNNYEIKKIERFFRSNWYKELTDIDGEYLIEQLRKK